MALYNNTRKNSPIAAVEFSPAPAGISVTPQEQFSFFHIRNDADKEAVLAQLASPQTGFEIVAESRINGHPLLIARSTKPQDDILKILAGNGDQFRVVEHKKKMSPWKLRGWASMIGQPLQLISGYLNKGGMDGATITFAISNLIANGTNIVFGAEKSKDAYHLRMLKESFNRSLTKYLPEKARLPDVDESHNKTPAGDAAAASSFTSKAFNFMKRYSVTVGEIGLRYFGVLALAFPILNWGKGWAELRNTGWKKLNYETFKRGVGKTLNTDKFTRYAGMTYLIGKTIAFTSKVPDPYNPTPHTPIDTFREKVAFRLSSIIETGGAAFIAYDRLFRREITWPNKKFVPAKWQGLHTRDWLGGIGGLLFMGGLIIRIFAPFGMREVDMNELNAHMTDGLAKIPREKLPQLLADTAVSVKQHFGDKSPELGQIFTQLTDDLYRYHGIALPNVPTNSATTLATAHPAQEETKAKSFASDGLKKSSNLAGLPRPTSHQERAASSQDAAALGA